MDTRITLTDNYFFKVKAVDRPEIWIEDEYGLFQYSKIVNEISRIVMFDWEQPEDKEDKHWFPGLNYWVRTQNAKALNGRIHDQWERLLDTLPEKVLDIHKSIYAHIFKQPEILHKDELYKYDKLIEDIKEYQACAVALDKLNYLGKDFLKKTKVDNMPNPISMGNVDLTNSSNSIIDSFWPESNLDYKLELLQDNWRKFFSDTGELYEELNKTIENLPGNLSIPTVLNLPKVHLQRPVTNRLEFITLLEAVDLLNNMDRIAPFMFAEEKQIKKAIDSYNENKMGGHRTAWQEHNDLGYGKTSQIRYFVRFLINNAVNYEGNIVDVTNNAIDQIIIEKM